MAATLGMCSRTRMIGRILYNQKVLQGSQGVFSRQGQRCVTNNTSGKESKEAEKEAAQESKKSTTEGATPEQTEHESKLTEQVEKLGKEVSELQDRYRRALAETENVRNRMKNQIQDTKLFGIQGFCKDLLEVADILGKATESVPKDLITNDNPHLKGLFDGLSMTETQLHKVFNRHGLYQIDPKEGEKFDPNVHEALFQAPASSKENVTADTVSAVTKIGYKLHDRTLRPALVGVYK